MVTRVPFLFLLFFSSFSFSLFSGEFTAVVSSNQVSLGKSFTLDLTLKDATSKAMPSVDALTQSFTIYSQQRLLNTIFNNGQMTSNITWKFVLLPKERVKR